MNHSVKKIYYVTKELLNEIETNYELIENKDWYSLYRSIIDNSYWRLDKWDKYQERFFTKLESTKNWTKFNDKELKIDLLKETRGLSDEKCVWKDCPNNALNGLAICELHAFNEMNIKK